jgi:hypothetical protein
MLTRLVTRTGELERGDTEDEAFREHHGAGRDEDSQGQFFWHDRPSFLGKIGKTFWC